MAIDSQKLADKILELRLVEKKRIIDFLRKSKENNIPLEDILFEREIIPDETLGKIVAENYNLEFIKISEINIPENILKIIPYNLAQHQYIIPFQQENKTLKVAICHPSNEELVSFIEKKTGLNIEPYYSTKKDIKFALKAYNKNVDSKFSKLLKGAMAKPNQIESLKESSKILDTIILFAYQNNASDIHIEPHKEYITIRFRIDGILHVITELPASLLELITTRIKVLAGLRTDEHRAAQDGRFKIELEKNDITLRVSILPTYDGEKTVLRLLSSANQELNLETLGYSKEGLHLIQNNILKTNGIILVTGPTGSGKTTTLYSILKLLNSPEVNISTIEDPIEYRLENVNQVQANKKSGLTFAAGLRSLLRQDPDIIMVGEIRDEETGGIAINSALTGHLVLSTLHTNDAATTLPRLNEMGIEAFLLSATVKLIIAQRLVRKVCQKCATTYTVKIDQLKELGKKFNFDKGFEEFFTELAERKPEIKEKIKDEITLWKHNGCGSCGGTGFKGRSSIAEVMEVTDSIKKLILGNGHPTEIEETARKEGMISMFEEGLSKALNGETTIEEVLRVMRN